MTLRFPKDKAELFDRLLGTARKSDFHDLLDSGGSELAV